MKPFAFIEFENIVRPLLDDVSASDKLCAASPNDFTRRSFVRTCITYLDGHLYAFKQVILAFEQVLCALPKLPRATKQVTILFTAAQRAMLEEFSYKIRDGQAQQSRYNVSFMDSLKFTVNTFHDAIGVASDVKYEGKGWESLCEARKIRNRLTHPKTLSDLELTDDDIKAVQAGVVWYERTTDHMLERLYTESKFSGRFSES